MCCFSGKVQSVSDTSIFARVGAQGNQVIIYSMKLKTAQEVAMVLPVPVKPGSGENAMRFFDFSAYPIHDGEVHRTAMFDHALFCQGVDVAGNKSWVESQKIASQFVKTARTHGMIRPEQHVYRCSMSGRFANGDVVAKASLPA